MVRLSVISAAALFWPVVGSQALCQKRSTGDTSTQFRKEWELGRPTDDLAKKDGSIDDRGVLGYLQQLANRLASVAGMRSVPVRLTQSSDQYASVLPNRGLYLSAGLLCRMGDEAELAGLIAHELAHLVQRQQGSSSDGTCVFDPLAAPSWPVDLREHERQATILAVSYLKVAQYDPTSLLSLLSKLSYEHPVWAKAITSEDLRDLRDTLESESPTLKGYRLDSSAFVQVHVTVEGMLERITKKSGNPVKIVRKD